MIPQPVRFKGAPGSPYTRKMMAYLRDRHTRYEFLIGEQADQMGMPQPKVSLLHDLLCEVGRRWSCFAGGFPRDCYCLLSSPTQNRALNEGCW